VVIIHYSNPRKKKTGDKSLNQIISNLSLKFKHETRVLMGDFNRDRESANQWFTTHNIRLPQIPRRWTWRRGNLRKELDYIGSNENLFNSSIIRDVIKSDHDLILSDLRLNDLRMETKPAVSATSTTIKKDIREHEVLAIMKDRNFPGIPFVELAAAKRLTQTQKLFYSDYES
jgi:hypothetical protein